MQIELTRDALPVIHALDSDTRIDILNALAKQNMTVTGLAKQLHYSKAIISKHVQLLQSAQLVYEIPSEHGDRRQKTLAANSDSIFLSLPEKIYPDFHQVEFNIPVGNYFAYSGISATCGLANNKEVIGEIDDPDSFLTANRISATLLWFSRGEVEYIIPNAFRGGRVPEMLEFSFEISSEFPGSNNNWPSDITFWLNDINVGTWTVPGNFSDVRGKLTPSWWHSDYSQYGLLKHLRIHKLDTGIDGQQLSLVSLKDLGLDQEDTLKFRVGVDPTSSNQGGLTLFGRDFGNFPQDIHVTYFYADPTN